MKVVVKDSTRDGKRYMVKVDNKTIHFGSDSHENYTMHGNKERRKLYIDRHKKREDWNDKTTAGFWSKHLLWNLPTLEASAKSLKSKGLNVSLDIK